MTLQSSPDLLGSAVKRYREQDLQLSQTDLAWLADVSRGTISNLETGKVTPDERTWHRIRTALALGRTSLQEIRVGTEPRPVMPSDAVQGIVAAILAIRNRNPEVGQRTAERWRHLVGRLTADDGRSWPETNSDLSWLARDVALMAPAENLQAIHNALHYWGWVSTEQIPAEGTGLPAPDSLDQVQALFRSLTKSVDEISAQLRVFHDETQGFDRLPARVQDLLTHGLVVDYDIDHPEAVPGVAIIDLVVVNEDESSLALRKEVRNATRRWSNILMVTRHIFEELAPDRDPQEILNAVEYALHAQGSNETDKMRQQARNGQPTAMYDLGKLLKKLGRADEAEHWLRRAADAGHPGALFHLGKLVQETGRADEAEHWLRRAADAGHPDAPFSLWKLVQETGRAGEAEQWLRRAAEAGHSGALFDLWKLVQETGRAGEAEQWLRRAAEAGHSGARFHLGKLVQETGPTDEAEKWLRRAAEQGHSGALSTVELMLYEKRKQTG